MLVLAAFGVACMIDVSEPMIRLPQDVLGSTGFPRIAGGLLALISVVTASYILFRGDYENTGAPLTRKSWGLIAVSCGYILGISYVGFAISTLIYLFLTSEIFCDFNRARLKGIIVYSFAVTTVAFVFFKIFKVYLPDTILF